MVQEVANAKEAWIHLGNLTFPWEWFRRIITTLRLKQLDIFLRRSNGVKAVAEISGLQDNRDNPDYRLGILNLLEETRGFRSTLPVDKIYAILGLVHPDDQQLVDVDYGLDAEEV